MDYLIRLESHNSFTIIKFDGMPMGEYHLFKGPRGWTCSCPDSVYRKTKCKHQVMIDKCIAKGTPQPFVVECV